MKSLYLTRIYPSHTIFTQAALVALMTFSMSDNIDNIMDNIDNIIEERGLAQWETGQGGCQGQGVCQVH